MSGWADHIEPIKGTRRSIYQASTRRCQQETTKMTLNGKARSEAQAAGSPSAAPFGEVGR